MALLDDHIDGKYEILGKLREGGMGAIYKVRHRLLDEVRVVKVVRSQADSVGEAADRFLREAKAAIKLRHPNIAVLHDFAVNGDGQAFIVMEFIDGWNLLEVLNAHGPPPVSLTLEIARQSLKALGYLHRQKIVHRDVSPDNLMLTRDVDGTPLVRLIDLGIAKALEGQGGLTTTGVFLGKPRYGSPERFSGGSWDARSDLYSFGVVMYELLTGWCPVVGNDPATLMAGHLFRPPLAFSQTDPEGRVPPELQAVVLKALAKQPEERMASAEDFVWELTMLQDRFPVTREELEGVWRVLLPLGTREVPLDDRPGSTQVRLDLEFGIGKTPPSGLVTGQATLRTAPAASPPPQEMLAAPKGRETSVGRDPDAIRRVAYTDDLDATWATRPLRQGLKPAGEPERPAPPAAGVRGAAMVKPSRRWGLWTAAVAAALALAAGGIWWARWSARRPAPAPTLPPAETTVATTNVLLEPSPAVSPPRAVETTKPTVRAEAPPGPAAQKKPAARRSPLPEEPAAAAGPLAPMKTGDLIRGGQPGVEPPEVQEIPNYPYPQAARGSGRKTAVRVAVLVDETGTVIDVQVREGDNSGLGFNEVAQDVARRARYLAPRRDGIAGKMWTELLLEFAESPSS